VSLSCLFGALALPGDGVGGDLRTWWGDAWHVVQAVFLTLILGRMHHRGACRVLAQDTHTMWRSAFGESIELCVRHRSVNYAAGTIVKRCNCISMIACAILCYCRGTKSWDDVHHPPSTCCDLHVQIHWLALCTWYVRHNQEFHAHIQYMCIDWCCFYYFSRNSLYVLESFL